MKTHEAEAAAHVEEAIVANRNGAWQTSQFEVKLAQVEATLAVAAQSRLAALIAALDGRDWALDEGWVTNAAPSVVERIKQRNAIRAQIREGLGLA